MGTPAAYRRSQSQVSCRSWCGCVQAVSMLTCAGRHAGLTDQSASASGVLASSAGGARPLRQLSSTRLRHTTDEASRSSATSMIRAGPVARGARYGGDSAGLSADAAQAPVLAGSRPGSATRSRTCAEASRLSPAEGVCTLLVIPSVDVVQIGLSVGSCELCWQL